MFKNLTLNEQPRPPGPTDGRLSPKSVRKWGFFLESPGQRNPDERTNPSWANSEPWSHGCSLKLGSTVRMFCMKRYAQNTWNKAYFDFLHLRASSYALVIVTLAFFGSLFASKSWNVREKYIKGWQFMTTWLRNCKKWYPPPQQNMDELYLSISCI